MVEEVSNFKEIVERMNEALQALPIGTFIGLETVLSDGVTRINVNLSHRNQQEEF